MHSGTDILTIIPLLVLGQIHSWISRHGTFFFVISHLPSTLMHELAHFSIAFVLGGHPTGINLWPERIGNRWTLGSVVSRATILSTTPTALAPILWAPAGFYLLAHRISLADGSLPHLCGIYLVAYLCFTACVPSWQDIKVAISHPMSLLLWSGIVWGALHFLTV